MGTIKKNYLVYIYDLFGVDKKTFMKRIEELEPPTRDKTKNFILQLEQKGREEQLYEIARKMVISGKSTEEICDLLDVSEGYVHRLREEIK